MTIELDKAHLVEKTGNIMTPRGRFVFASVAEKFRSKEDKAKDKSGAYVITMVIPDHCDLTALKDAVKAKAAEKWGTKLPGNLRLPLRKCKDVFDKNGDPKYPEEYAEFWQITANTYETRPGVVDMRGRKLSEPSPDESADDVTERLKNEVYSGRWGRITVSPATYDTDGNRGVKLYLQNVQTLDHDDRLGGRGAKAEDEFGAPAAAAKAESADALFG